MTPQTADAGRHWISSEHAPSLRLRRRRRRLLLLLLLVPLPPALENRKFETMSGGDNVAIPVEKLRFRSRASSSLEVSGDSHRGTRADESGGQGLSSTHAERREQISLINAANQVNWSRILDPRSIFNPHDKFVRYWNKVFFTSCLVAIFIDPLFFFVISVNEQISTLAGNQVPSDFIWEILFTMSIIALGLLLFALLIGNVQNFLQSLGKRKLDLQLRRRDFEMWMRRRRMPPELKEKIRKSEKFSWSVTRGVNEEHLMENLPDNLKKEIRRHLFAFLKEAPIFSKMEEPILDAFRQLLTRKVYLDKSTAQERGSPIDKMIFIVRGQMESIGAQEVPLSEGGVCGEELLVWHLEAIYAAENEGKGQSSISRPPSNREVKCKRNVEAFVLSSSDLEGVIANFKPNLLQHREVIRHEIEKCKAAAAFEQSRGIKDGSA